VVTEIQKYTVVDRYPGFEVRRYAAHVVAEVRVQGPADTAGNRAFRSLAGYIGGRNDASRGVSMTAPVLQRPAVAGRSIAMTAPVLQQPAEGSKGSGESEDGAEESIVSFVMPAAESLETLPRPSDPSVTLRAVPEGFAAAASYSGRWTTTGYEQRAARLDEAVRAAGLEPTGPAQWARYDPPWKPWFLRRNEVLLPITTA
jgi:hypothetical protein